MAISTNSIIHYTETLEALKGIIKEGFKIKYCAESLILSSKENGGSFAAHPMISFCDIPLSESKQHFEAYGKYGIGLSKEWAVKTGANPVLYLNKDSLIANNILNLIKERRKNTSNLSEEVKSDVLRIKAYAKNYIGPLKRNGTLISSKYNFYDEREWRLVPLKNQLNGAIFSVALDDYNKDKDSYNKKLEPCRFKFEPKEISYIIVSKTSEIPTMVKFIRDVYDEVCSAKDLDILFSKICSTEQIISDY